MRQAQAVIHLDALRHNLDRVRACAPASRVYAAIKANAYGHGALRVAQALDRADGFALASIGEALHLRENGLRQRPLMVLSARLTPADLQLCAEHGLQPVAYTSDQVAALAGYSGATLQAWIKLDTGMHRLGIEPEQARAAYTQITANSSVELAGWMTHLACADDVRNDQSQRQMETFKQALGDLPGARSVANSAGIVAWPSSHQDVVRPGIMLYGASPMLERTAADLDLRAAMTLSAPLLSVRDIATGEPVGYGATWRASKPSRIGVIGIGYGDGYPRHLPNGTPVLINGQRAGLAGRVSMDMIAVDLSDCPNAQVGQQAILWGQDLPADEIARAAGTIAYELFCQITNRVVFSYEN